MKDLSRFQIPGHLTLEPGAGGLTRLRIQTHASAGEIYLHGAQVTHFCKTGEPPLLFLSSRSGFTPGTAIRGGVPVVFPWFGPQPGQPSHGYARITEWDLRETSLLENGAVQVRLALTSDPRYQVDYRITFHDTLTMEITVQNLANSEATLETCLHSYFQISDIREVAVWGLKGASYLDQVSGVNLEETSDAILIHQETDRIYRDTAAPVTIMDPVLRRSIRLEKSGSLSTVVWNPWVEKSQRLTDMEDSEYLQMICVESGNVGPNRLHLPPAGSAVMQLVISSAPMESAPPSA